jgi:hypothetical protein
MNDLLVACTTKRCGPLVLDPKLLPRTWLAAELTHAGEMNFAKASAIVRELLAG